jgi:hypothetical protein
MGLTPMHWPWPLNTFFQTLNWEFDAEGRMRVRTVADAATTR